MTWIASRDAHSQDFRAGGNNVVEWAAEGLIATRARAVSGVNWPKDDDGFVLLPQAFWQCMMKYTGSAYRTWAVGTFRATFWRGRDRDQPVNAFGVEFSAEDLSLLTGVGGASPPITAPSAHDRRIGRPSKVELALAIFRRRIESGRVLSNKASEARAIVAEWAGSSPPVPETVADALRLYYEESEWEDGRLKNAAVIQGLLSDKAAK